MKYRASLLVSLVLGHWVARESSSLGAGILAFFLLLLVCWMGCFIWDLMSIFMRGGTKYLLSLVFSLVAGFWAACEGGGAEFGILAFSASLLVCWCACLLLDAVRTCRRILRM